MLDTLETRIVDTGHSITIMMIEPDELFPVATASASFHDNDDRKFWFVNRVLVTKEHLKGQGLGSFALASLKDAIQKKGNEIDIIVTPGGYGADPDRQANFYVKNGFEFEDEGYYRFRINKEQAS